MTLDSVAALVDLLRQTQLVEAARQEELAKLAETTAEPRALIKALVQRGWLTTYQANEVMLGRAADLVLGPYLILERLAEGGMGQVFKARHLFLKRLVALKVVKKELAGDVQMRWRFERELELAGQLVHPNIVLAHDAGHAGDRHYLVMEYVEGVDLERQVRKHGPLTVTQACSAIAQAATGLEHALQRGLVHRDIKPSNLLITTKTGQGGTAIGSVKVLDMGLARRDEHQAQTAKGQTRFGALMGTPDYLAPEQAWNAHEADIRADIYSLGCTLFFLLTGRPPFDGSLEEKLRQHQQEEASDLSDVCPNVPAALAAAVRKMMAKRPADRYQTPADVVAALTPWCRDVDSAQPAPTTSDRPDAILGYERGFTLMLPTSPTTAPTGGQSIPPAPAQTMSLEPSLAAARLDDLSLQTPPALPAGLIEESTLTRPTPPWSSAPAGLSRGWWLVIAGGLAGLLAIVLLILRPWSSPSKDPEHLVLGDAKASETPATKDIDKRSPSDKPPMETPIIVKPRPMPGAVLITRTEPPTPLAGRPFKVHLIRTVIEPGFVYEFRRGSDGPWTRVDGNIVALDGLTPGDLILEFRAVDDFGNSTPLLKRKWSIEGEKHSPVTSVAFSADGSQILTGGNVVTLWDVATGKEVRRFTGGGGGTELRLEAFFSPDGRHVLGWGGIRFGSSKTLVLWDRASGSPRWQIPEDTRIGSLAFDPRTSHLLCVGMSSPLFWLDSLGREVKVNLEASGFGYLQGLIDGSGKRVLLIRTTFAACYEYDLASGKLIKEFSVRNPSGTTPAFPTLSADGRYLAGRQEDLRIHLWDVETGKELRTFAGNVPKGTRFVFSRDGKHLVCGAPDGTVRLWDVDTGMEVRRFEGHVGPVHGVAISPDADLVLTGGEDATIRLWDRRTGKEIKQFGR